MADYVIRPGVIKTETEVVTTTRVTEKVAPGIYATWTAPRTAEIKLDLGTETVTYEDGLVSDTRVRNLTRKQQLQELAHITYTILRDGIRSIRHGTPSPVKIEGLPAGVDEALGEAKTLYGAVMRQYTSTLKSAESKKSEITATTGVQISEKGLEQLV